MSGQEVTKRESLKLAGPVLNPGEAEIPSWVMQNLQVLDTDKKGELDEAELQQLCRSMATLRQMRADDTPEIDIGMLPKNVQEILQQWDPQGRGKVRASCLETAVQAHKKMRDENRTQWKLAAGGFLGLILLVTMNFILGMEAIRMAKDIAAQENESEQTAVLRTIDTDLVVLTASADTQIDAEGNMKPRSLSASGPVRMSGARMSARLSSLLADFSELIQVQHTLFTASVLSSNRVMTSQGKCGSVVHLNTDIGRLTLDDDDLILSKAAEANLKADGISLAGAIASRGVWGATLKADDAGRRLSSSVQTQGVFNALSALPNWTCDSVEAPAAFIQDLKSYSYTGSLLEECKGAACLSEGQLKAGVAKNADIGAGHYVSSTVEASFDSVTGKKMVITTMPNHSGQKLVELSDVMGTKRFQLYGDSDVFYCSSSATPSWSIFDSMSADQYMHYQEKDSLSDKTAVRKFSVNSEDGSDSFMYWDHDDSSKKPYMVSSPKSASFQLFSSFSATADTAKINAMFTMYGSKCPSSKAEISGVAGSVPAMGSPLDVSAAASAFYLAAASPGAAKTPLAAKTADLPERTATSTSFAPALNDASDLFTGHVLEMRSAAGAFSEIVPRMSDLQKPAAEGSYRLHLGMTGAVGVDFSGTTDVVDSNDLKMKVQGQIRNKALLGAVDFETGMQAFDATVEASDVLSLTYAAPVTSWRSADPEKIVEFQQNGVPRRMTHQAYLEEVLDFSIAGAVEMQSAVGGKTTVSAGGVVAKWANAWTSEDAQPVSYTTAYPMA